MRTFPTYINQDLRPVIDERIGELIRDGKTVYYTHLDGTRYVENESFAEIAAFVWTEEEAKRQRAARVAKAAPRLASMLKMFDDVAERANAEILAGNGGGARQILESYRREVATLLGEVA